MRTFSKTPKGVKFESNRLNCSDFKKGANRGNCDGMGHYLCNECKWRKPKKERKNDVWHTSK